MRIFSIAADVAMGVFLGMFLFAGLFTIWPGLRTLPVGVAAVAASVVIVLFRRPNGSFAGRDGSR